MEFFDSEGRRTGELRNLVTKAVRDTRHIDPVRFGEAPVEPAPPAGGAQAHADVVSAGETAGVVASVVAARIGVPAEQVDTHTSYYELGLDSATLLQMASEIGSRLGAKLSPTSLFEHPTVAGLAAHIVELHGPAVPAVEAPDPSPGRAVHDEPSVPGAQVAERSAAPARETGPGDIAIVGLGGRYPKAGDVTEFWENLKAGRDCVTEVPENRWPRDTFRGKRTPSGRTMASWGGFLDDVDCFDADFFGVPADEAAQLDPQERMFLEVCWEAIEDAGYTPVSLTGTTVRGPRRAVGVFVGVMHKDYVLVQHDAADGVGPAPLSLNSASIAHRVSHFCDFNGPSMAVDTVCASSLSALHLAVESLRRGECHAALAGGVNLSLHPAKYRAYGALELLASDTPARSFGAGADGYVPAEAVGAVLLKPLSSAIADGDDIYAVIKGTAVNHSGRTPGLRTPSVAAQAALIEDCLDRAGIDPASLGYLEAHGTGTEIGDLIEIQALRKVFEERTDAKRFCALGSVKSAIGHAEAAAGISALTKAALQLHHATLTPMVRAERPNPYLDLDDSPFRLQTDLEEWTVDVTGPAGGAASGRGERLRRHGRQRPRPPGGSASEGRRAGVRKRRTGTRARTAVRDGRRTPPCLRREAAALPGVEGRHGGGRVGAGPHPPDGPCGVGGARGDPRVRPGRGEGRPWRPRARYRFRRRQRVAEPGGRTGSGVAVARRGRPAHGTGRPLGGPGCLGQDRRALDRGVRRGLASPVRGDDAASAAPAHVSVRQAAALGGGTR